MTHSNARSLFTYGTKVSGGNDFWKPTTAQYNAVFSDCRVMGLYYQYKLSEGMSTHSLTSHSYCALCICIIKYKINALQLALLPSCAGACLFSDATVQ